MIETLFAIYQVRKEISRKWLIGAQFVALVTMWRMFRQVYYIVTQDTARGRKFSVKSCQLILYCQISKCRKMQNFQPHDVVDVKRSLTIYRLGTITFKTCKTQMIEVLTQLKSQSCHKARSNDFNRGILF